MEVTADVRRLQLELRLVPQAVISGQIVDTSGLPSVGLSVRLLRSTSPINRDNNPPFATLNAPESSLTSTNDKGQFRFFGLQAGEYYVQVVRAEGALPRFVYYPGVLDHHRAISITARPGEEVRLPTITVEKPKLVPVRFYFSDPNRKAITKSLVYSPTDSLIEAVRSVVSVSGGLGGPQEIVTSWVPGHYEVLLIFNSDRKETFYARTSVDVGDQGIDQEIVLSPTYQVRGRFVDEGQGTPIPTGQMGCFFVPESFSDGSQTFDGCTGQFSSGRYLLEFHDLPQDAYIVGVTAADRDVLIEGIDVHSNVDFDITLGRNGGVLSGTVKDKNDRAVGDASVILVPDGPSRAARTRYKAVLTNFDGSFEMAGIAPGEYHVYCWQDFDGVISGDSNFMKAYEEKGVPIEIAKGQLKMLNLTILEQE